MELITAAVEQVEKTWSEFNDLLSEKIAAGNEELEGDAVKFEREKDKITSEASIIKTKLNGSGRTLSGFPRVEFNTSTKPSLIFDSDFDKINRSSSLSTSNKWRVILMSAIKNHQSLAFV